MKDFAEILGKIVTVLPADWPGCKLAKSPGDLSQYIPQGFGLGGPNMLMPGDNLESMTTRHGYYGLDTNSNDPIRNAPTTNPSGGTIYFDHWVKQSTLIDGLRIMGFDADADTVKYVVFSSTSSKVEVDRYLDQIRIVCADALHSLFGVPPDIEVSPAPINLGLLIWRFIELQRERWQTDELWGIFGGDGDWARERLGFGFMVENSYWGVYRLWSRPWLSTK